MSDQEAFERIVTSLYDAMLDDTRWAAASALIDEACGLTGNGLMVGDGPKDDVRALFVGLYYRGQRREDLEREYLENYHPTDERVPRFRQLPDGRLVHVKDLYSAEELKTSPAYNEAMLRGRQQDGLNVRLDGPDGSHITLGLGDPVDSDGWGSSRIAMVQGLLPHIRQFVRVRADANAATAGGRTALMTAARTGDVAAVEVLLANGADVHATDDTHGQTALMWAAAENNAGVVDTLVRAGADVGARTQARLHRPSVRDARGTHRGGEGVAGRRRGAGRSLVERRHAAAAGDHEQELRARGGPAARGRGSEP